MTIQVTSLQNTNVLRLAGNLDIYSVDKARDALLDHLKDKPGLELDLSGIGTCDTAGLQLILSARSGAAVSRKSFSILNSSPAIEHCRELLGLNAETNLPHIYNS